MGDGQKNRARKRRPAFAGLAQNGVAQNGRCNQRADPDQAELHYGGILMFAAAQQKAETA